MPSSYASRQQGRSPMRYVRKEQQSWWPRPQSYSTRERDSSARPSQKSGYGISQRPPAPFPDPRYFQRYYQRRDGAAQRSGSLERPARQATRKNDNRRTVPTKRTRVVRKKPVKESKTKDQLDMELDKYMGTEAIKSRLDDQLANYFAEEAKEEE
ncbi:Fop carboxy-terminal duplication domain-containing protein, putative [Babesia caballi]|uniref:Fop carboxy-terminal duplication domain-containing protein, putative n=1 Tax=Babesia caballi TaxID=5871 RepID=A0AAV4M198_BABCB|nr:Fop carboxy-terminal duplication domain-containing protein, putative [Babesia caballi]